MTYMVFDSETQIHKSRKRTANPFDDRNYVVMRGWKVEGDPRCSMRYHKDKADSERRPLDIPDHVDVLVGFNIKFDLLYEMVVGNESLKAFYKRGGRVWCCQYAEYLLRAQARKYQMCSLDQIIESYGGRKKIDGMKEFWNAGVHTSDIDPALVEDYLIGTEEELRNSGDIGNTELIYLGQIAEAEALGMTAAIHSRMDGLCATTEMEFNGCMVDRARAREDLGKLAVKQATATVALAEYTTSIPAEVGFSWTSPIHKSVIIFGGRIRYEKSATYIDPSTGKDARLVATVKWPLFNGIAVDTAYDNVVWSESKQMWAEKTEYGWRPQDCYVSGKKIGEPKFKNAKGWGEKKTKIQDFFYDMPGYTEGRKEWETARLDGAGNACYGTGEEVMDVILKRDIPFLQTLKEYSALVKEIGTYYVKTDDKGNLSGMLTCIGPDGIIHHKLNHNTTVTTRLASSDPNMQNIPRGDKSDVKAMFISRFEGGVMGELDYSQLEVVVQGLLSLDKNLCRDLNNRIDFHCKRVALKNKCSYVDALYWCKDEDYEEFAWWKQERTRCKIFSFQRAYGAGATTISDETGMPVEEVKGLMVEEDKEYPGVVAFNNAVEMAVVKSAEWFRDGQRGWRPFRKGQWQAPTGTLYEWRSWDAQKWQRERGITESFSPPEMKNYPVQGTGGEIVQMTLGVLWRWFVATDNFGGLALLVNTVHDCVWVDMHPSVVAVVIPGMKKIMEAVPQLLKLKFGINCPVPFPVDAETGPNMLNLHHYEAA